MADNIELNLGAGGKTVATDEILGVQHELVKIEFGSDGSATQVSAVNPLPVTDAVAEAALASIAAEDFATQTTLAAILAKIIAAPATEATLASILTKIIGASATGTTTSVNDSASNITLLAANANRLGATVFNDSTEVLYLKLGATGSLTSFTVKMNPNAYYEVPFSYAGIIDGIWANNAAGAARVTELTV